MKVLLIAIILFSNLSYAQDGLIKTKTINAMIKNIEKSDDKWKLTLNHSNFLYLLNLKNSKFKEISEKLENPKNAAKILKITYKYPRMEVLDISE